MGLVNKRTANPPKGRAKALTEIEAREVSLVTRGAVKRKWALMKADIADILERVAATPGDDDAVIDAALEAGAVDAKVGEVIKSLGRTTSAYKDELPPWVVQLIAQLLGIKADETSPAPPTLSAAQAANKEDPNEVPMSKEETAKADAALPAEVQERLEAVQKEQREATEKAEAFRKRYEAERDLRRAKEFVEKAQTDYAGLGEPKDIGSVLKSLDDELAERNPKLQERIETLLKTACSRERMAELFKEHGREGSPPEPTPASPQGRAEAIAKSLRDKQPELSHAQALAKAYSENPALYEDYRLANPAPRTHDRA